MSKALQDNLPLFAVWLLKTNQKFLNQHLSCHQHCWKANVFTVKEQGTDELLDLCLCSTSTFPGFFDASESLQWDMMNRAIRVRSVLYRDSGAGQNKAELN